MAANGAVISASSSTHRLPTVSATQALRSAQRDESNNISLGLGSLDERLSNSNRSGYPSTQKIGGLTRGQLTEIYGPPGAGKSTICVQASVAALSAGSRVVWVDGGTMMCGLRLKNLLQRKYSSEKTISPTENVVDEILQRFVHFSIPTMPHLLALLTCPSSSFPPDGTSLVIIDSLTTLFDNAFIQAGADRSATQKTERNKWMADRRQVLLGDLTSKLSKLAVLRNVAVMITNNITTKIVNGAEASLRPSLTGREWEMAFSTRILLFRDWLPANAGDKDQYRDKSSLHFAEIVKPIADPGTSNLFAFTIDGGGIRGMSIDALHTDTAPVPERPPVRAAKRPYAEIADSDEATSDSEYGWLEDDAEELAAEGLVDDAEELTAAELVNDSCF